MKGDVNQVDDEGNKVRNYKEIGFTEALRKRYLKNNAFFFIGCFCAIYARNFAFSTIFALCVLIGKILEIIGDRKSVV